VQLVLHATLELHTLGHVPPSACSTVSVPPGAGSSGADEQPTAASARIANAESKGVTRRAAERVFDFDMMLFS
jgi:hypothetical protein